MSSASLYVGDLSPDVPESTLYKYFNDIGEVSSVRVLRDAQTRRSLGYAYVNFHRADDAEKALEIMNYKPIGDSGRPVRIMWSQRDPQLRKSGKGNVFVKGLAPSIDHEQLRDTFVRFGSILSCKVAQNSAGESLGYGFVHFQNESDSKVCIERSNGMEVAGKQITVSPFMSRAARGSAGNFTNVYAKNLPQELKEEDFKNLFSEYGTITSHKLVVCEGENKTNFGFVNFKTSAEAKAAIEALNNSMQGDKKLVVNRAQKREERKKILSNRFEQMKADRAMKYHGVNLYVKNLSDKITDESLRQMFSDCGSITSAKVMTDSNNKSKGFGFVCFATPEAAMTAINGKNGIMEDGKPLYVAMAQRRADRQAGIQERLNRVRASKANAGGHMYPGNFPRMPPMMYGTQGWPGQPGMGMGMPMAGGRPPFQLVQANGGHRGPPRRGRGRGQQGNRMMHQQQFKMANDVRNAPGPRGNQAEPVRGLTETPTRDFAAQMAHLSGPDRKIAFGEQLFPQVAAKQPDLAPKITGMLLEMDDAEIMELLESQEALNKKINEAINVLNEAAVSAE
jgi:polyadenylate-binding protein